MSKAKKINEQYRKLDVYAYDSGANAIALSILSLPTKELADITGLSRYRDVHRFRELFYTFALNSEVQFTNWREAFKIYMEDEGVPVNKHGHTQEMDIRRLMPVRYV